MPRRRKPTDGSGGGGSGGGGGGGGGGEGGPAAGDTVMDSVSNDAPADPSSLAVNAQSNEAAAADQMAIDSNPQPSSSSSSSSSAAAAADAADDTTSSRGRRRRPTPKRAAMDADSVTGSPSHGPRRAAAGRAGRHGSDDAAEDTDPEPSGDDGNARKARKTDDGAVIDEQVDPADQQQQPADGGDVVLATLTDDSAHQAMPAGPTADANSPAVKKRSRKERDNNLVPAGAVGSAASFQPMSMISPGSVSPSATSYSFNIVAPSTAPNNNGLSLHMLPSSVGAGTEGTAATGGSSVLGSSTPTLAGMVGGSLSLNALQPIPAQGTPASPEKTPKRKAPLSYSRKDKSLGLLCEK